MSEGNKGGVSGRERIARLLDGSLPTLGAAVVLGAVVLSGGDWTAIWVAVLGLLMVEAGVWRLGSRVMHERRYTPLRREVERFVGLARQLHRATAAAATSSGTDRRAALDRTIASMQASLERMVAVAGKTEADLEAEAGRAAPAHAEALPSQRQSARTA